MARVLVVDDDHTVREVVVSYLRAHRHEVVEAADGETALRVMRETPADLVVLDLMLPGIDGLEVCRRLRTASEVPVIMLTALGSETDRVVGLERGADDYVTKPFSPRELALRVDSVLRRSGERPAAPTRLTDGDLVVDTGSHVATLGDQVLALTVREFDLLRFLLANPGVAYSRDELLQQVWGWSFGDQSTVTVHVRRLREKVEADPTRPVRLVTVWGVGYRWEASVHARRDPNRPDRRGLVGGAGALGLLSAGPATPLAPVDHAGRRGRRGRRDDRRAGWDREGDVPLRPRLRGRPAGSASSPAWSRSPWRWRGRGVRALVRALREDARCSATAASYGSSPGAGRVRELSDELTRTSHGCGVPRAGRTSGGVTP